jgi:curli biogenesis system outer membrane secretion channel CsgG
VAKQTRQVLAVLLSLSLAAPASASECKTEEIKKNADGSFTYSKECHVRVGEVVGELDLRREEVKLLRGSLKDLSVGYDIQQKRAEDWLQTSLKLEDTIQRQKRISDLEKWLWFGAGILLMYGATSAVSK